MVLVERSVPWFPGFYVRWHDVAPAPLVLGAEPAAHSVWIFYCMGREKGLTVSEYAILEWR